jgi:hypothetical protein
MTDHEWISYLEAARLIECSHMTITRTVHDGRLVHRAGARRHPSISQASARQVGVEWRALQQARTEATQGRAARRTPPDDGDVWLDAKAAAAVLGVSTNAIYQRVLAGRMPFTLHGGTKWFRRADIEMRAAVRSFQSQSPGG